MQSITFTANAAQELRQTLDSISYDRLFILCDENTERQCLPYIQRPEYQPSNFKSQFSIIKISAGDKNKNIDSLSHVWQALQQAGATRHSLLINLGGGMVTDLGGFAAATFKRGIRFINLPTTLLAMVDASVGGKTGINFNGLKNEIGAFCEAQQVIIDTHFLLTLDSENILAGYAEMIKHALISNTNDWAELLNFNINQPDLTALSAILQRNIQVKERIVEQDPHENGLRKALNLGHTIGHAFESLAMEQSRAVPHGYAVAWGIICELYLSSVKLGFPTDKMRQTVNFIRHHYGQFQVTCDNYPRLLQLMTHDKKNTGTDINFTLLADIGDIRLNQNATHDEICEALDFYRETI